MLDCFYFLHVEPGKSLCYYHSGAIAQLAPSRLILMYSGDLSDRAENSNAQQTLACSKMSIVSQRVTTENPD